MRSLLILVLFLLSSCTTDTDRFKEFEAEYEPAMQELTSLVKDADSAEDCEASALADRCKSVSEETCKRALVMQEKANALRDEETRKISTTVANDLKDAGKDVERLGSAYTFRAEVGNELVFPGDSRFEYRFDYIVKKATLKKLVSKIESEHAALKGVMARK